jgi:hypothetical protein
VHLRHQSSHQQSTRRSRLRSALAAELRAMLDLYKKNLQLIEKKADYILSTRSSVVVYRSSIARLTMLLDDPLIEQIVGVLRKTNESKRS